MVPCLDLSSTSQMMIANPGFRKWGRGLYPFMQCMIIVHNPPQANQVWLLPFTTIGGGPKGCPYSGPLDSILTEMKLYTSNCGYLCAARYLQGQRVARGGNSYIRSHPGSRILTPILGLDSCLTLPKICR